VARWQRADGRATAGGLASGSPQARRGKAFVQVGAALRKRKAGVQCAMSGAYEYQRKPLPSRPTSVSSFFSSSSGSTTCWASPPSRTGGVTRSRRSSPVATSSRAKSLARSTRAATPRAAASKMAGVRAERLRRLPELYESGWKVISVPAALGRPGGTSRGAVRHGGVHAGANTRSPCTRG